MNNDSSEPLLQHTHERSAATLRQTDGATRKPTQQKYRSSLGITLSVF